MMTIKEYKEKSQLFYTITLSMLDITTQINSRTTPESLGEVSQK